MIRSYSEYYRKGLGAVQPGDDVVVKVKLSRGYDNDFTVYISDIGQPVEQMDKMEWDRARQVAQALFPYLHTEDMGYRR